MIDSFLNVDCSQTLRMSQLVIEASCSTTSSPALISWMQVQAAKFSIQNDGLRAQFSFRPEVNSYVSKLPLEDFSGISQVVRDHHYLP